MRTYRSGFQDKAELLEALKKSNLKQKVALALHSAAEAHGCKNTNLNTLELYLLDPLVRPQLEKKLLLEPQERGYEVLLIEPYYKSLLKSCLRFKSRYQCLSSHFDFFGFISLSLTWARASRIYGRTPSRA